MNELYENIVSGKEKISLVGLGYVGMPIAVAFAKKVKVLGFDVNAEKIAQYKKGFDPTKEVGDQAIRETTVDFTSDANRLKEAKLHIVAVHTTFIYEIIPNLYIITSARNIDVDIYIKGTYDV